MGVSHGSLLYWCQPLREREPLRRFEACGRCSVWLAETKNHPKVASDIHNIASVGLEAPTRPIY
nr:MAG TPA: hypothetical protein [Caudoviricetes sp.]